MKKELEHKLKKELNHLRNLSYREAQRHPELIFNFYDDEIEELFGIARRNAIELDEEGHFDMDQKSIAVAKKRK